MDSKAKANISANLLKVWPNFPLFLKSCGFFVLLKHNLLSKKIGSNLSYLS